MPDLKVDTAIMRKTDPLRKIVEDIHDSRGPGYLRLECGHLREKEWGKKYGQSTRCYRCSQVQGWLTEIDDVRVDLDRARELLAAGKIAESTNIYTWNLLSELHGKLRATLEKAAE